MSQSDAELVARTRAGDALAFEALMRRHFRAAFLVAYAQLGDRAEGEDVCQEAFFRCWERIAECRDPARVGAWVSTVVRNMAHNRRTYLRRRRADTLEAAAHVPALERTHAEVELSELRERLEAAMRTLSAVQREVVLLHDLEGWRHAEVAHQLGISTLMSRRHLSDARRLLRAVLGDALAQVTDHD